MVDDRVVGTLVAASPDPTAVLTRATTEVARWVSSQVELAELDASRARLAEADEMDPALIEEWRGRISRRITHRIIKSIRGEKPHPRHPEALLPVPKRLIVLEVDGIVDLTPGHMK